MGRALFAIGLALLLRSSRRCTAIAYQAHGQRRGCVDVSGGGPSSTRWDGIALAVIFIGASPDDIAGLSMCSPWFAITCEQEVADVGSADRITLATAFIGLDEDGRPANKADTLSLLRASRATARTSAAQPFGSATTLPSSAASRTIVPSASRCCSTRLLGNETRFMPTRFEHALPDVLTPSRAEPSPAPYLGRSAAGSCCAWFGPY